MMRPGRRRGAIAAASALLGGLLLGGCAPAAQPAAGSSRASSGPAAPPEALAGSTWDQVLRVGSAPQAQSSLGDSAVPDLEPDPDGAISLPTGLGDDSSGPVAEPVRVALPRLGIDSQLDPLRLLRNGGLQAPPRWGTAGWFTGGPRPGERGPAVIAGHLDSPSGAAVFAALPRVRPGDQVRVTDAAGAAHVFEVTRVARTPKRGFPTQEVYGAAPGPELRLITCTGEYLASAGGYQDNLLVFARMVQ